jgi:hypothetical protein
MKVAQQVEHLEPDLKTECPAVCPKPGCGGTVFLPHEDGWQCFNCMKIIYKASVLPADAVKIAKYSRDKTN